MIKQTAFNFADIARAKRAAEVTNSESAVEAVVAKPEPAPVTPPTHVQHATRSGLVICRRGKDGRIDERSARPAFLFRDPKSASERIVLPPDYYWRDSPQHLARRAELESGA